MLCVCSALTCSLYLSWKCSQLEHLLAPTLATAHARRNNSLSVVSYFQMSVFIFSLHLFSISCSHLKGEGKKKKIWQRIGGKEEVGGWGGGGLCKRVRISVSLCFIHSVALSLAQTRSSFLLLPTPAPSHLLSLMCQFSKVIFNYASMSSVIRDDTAHECVPWAL